MSSVPAGTRATESGWNGSGGRAPPPAICTASTTQACTASAMDKTVRMADAAERATEIVTDVLEGRMEKARQSFNSQVREMFTDEKWGSGLATVAGMVGAFEGFGEAEP